MLCVRSGDSTLGHVCRLTDLRHQIQTRGPTGVKSHQIGVPNPQPPSGPPEQQHVSETWSSSASEEQQHVVSETA